MTLLTAVQSHCQVYGLAVPGQVMGNSDATVSQLLGVANRLLDMITEETNFQAFTYEALFNYIAAEDQGPVEDLAGGLYGYQWMHNKTFYDRTLRRPVYGPLTDIEWQQIKAIPNPGPFYKYRIRGGNLLINPVPTAPLSEVAFEYASSFGVKNAGGTPQQYFTADTDTFVLPERILRAGLAFLWKQIKGFPSLDEEARFWNQVNNAIARDGTKPDLNMAHNHLPDVSPGVFVPSGNWPIS